MNTLPLDVAISSGPTDIFWLLGLLPALAAGILAIIFFYLIFKFITMNSTPFRAMKAIYVYLAAFVGLILVAMGLYAIIEHILEVLFAGVPFYSPALITPVTQILVGVFVMVPHWMIGHHFNLIEHGHKKK